MLLQRVPALANFTPLIVIPLYSSHVLHYFAIVCYLVRFLGMIHVSTLWMNAQLKTVSHTQLVAMSRWLPSDLYCVSIMLKTGSNVKSSRLVHYNGIFVEKLEIFWWVGESEMVDTVTYTQAPAVCEENIYFISLSQSKTTLNTTVY